MSQNLWESSLVWIRPRAPTKCQMILWKGFPRNKERGSGDRGMGEGGEREIMVLKQHNANYVEDNPNSMI